MITSHGLNPNGVPGGFPDAPPGVGGVVGDDPLFPAGRANNPVRAVADGVPINLPGTPLPVDSPIPGVDGSGMGQSELLCSMVHHMGRLPNPDVTAKPGTSEGIRRIDEIHVFVAMCFDNHTVNLRPVVVGRNLATTSKSLNDRLKPLCDNYRIQVGFSDRLCLSTACLTWGGRDKEEEHSQPRLSSKLGPRAISTTMCLPRVGHWGIGLDAHITLKHGVVIPLTCLECLRPYTAQSGYQRGLVMRNTWEKSIWAFRLNTISLLREGLGAHWCPVGEQSCAVRPMCYVCTPKRKGRLPNIPIP